MKLILGAERFFTSSKSFSLVGMTPQRCFPPTRSAKRRSDWKGTRDRTGSGSQLTSVPVLNLLLPV